MEIQFCVPKGTNIEVAQREYSDIFQDSWDDESQTWWLGASPDEERDDDEEEWLSYDEAVEACGFLDGAFPEGSTMIEGNGGWAQGMISVKDFSRYAMTEGEKAERIRISGIYWAAKKRGVEATKSMLQERRKLIFA